MNREKVIKWLEYDYFPRVGAYRKDCKQGCDACMPMHDGDDYCDIDMLYKILALLKEHEKLVDVDALREKLGLAKDCAECKQNSRACQYDSHFSLMDFCERFDMAIEELMQEGR